MYTNSVIMTEVNTGFVAAAVMSCLTFAPVVLTVATNNQTGEQFRSAHKNSKRALSGKFPLKSSDGCGIFEGNDRSALATIRPILVVTGRHPHCRRVPKM